MLKCLIWPTTKLNVCHVLAMKYFLCPSIDFCRFSAFIPSRLVNVFESMNELVGVSSEGICSFLVVFFSMVQCVDFLTLSQNLRY